MLPSWVSRSTGASSPVVTNVDQPGGPRFVQTERGWVSGPDASDGVPSHAALRRGAWPQKGLDQLMAESNRPVRRHESDAREGAWLAENRARISEARANGETQVWVLAPGGGTGVVTIQAGPLPWDAPSLVAKVVEKVQRAYHDLTQPVTRNAENAAWREVRDLPPSNPLRRSQQPEGRRERFLRAKAIEENVSVAEAARRHPARGPRPRNIHPANTKRKR
jgi:hypothetical protein